MPDHIRQCINPPSVTTVAPLSLAVRLDDTVHLSGLVGKVPETGKLAGGVKEQTHQILKNMGVVLQAAGCSYDNVIKTTVLLTDIKDFTTVNEIYKQYFFFRWQLCHWAHLLKSRLLLSWELLPMSSDRLAVRLDDTVHLSGLVGKVPETGQLAEGVKEQTHQILKNMGVVLEAAGSSYEKVIKTTVLLTDINDFTTVNEIYKQYFKTNYPARSAFQVVALPLGALVEIEAVAVLGTVEDVE